MVTINGRIKQVRISANLTQTEFAERIGLTKNYISLVENGQRAPSDRTINDICREFGVNETWLRDGIGEPFAAKDRADEMAEFIKGLMSDSPDSFRSRLVTALLRFDPDGAEWDVLERIYESVAAEQKKEGKP